MAKEITKTEALEQLIEEYKELDKAEQMIEAWDVLEQLIQLQGKAKDLSHELIDETQPDS